MLLGQKSSFGGTRKSLVLEDILLGGAEQFKDKVGRILAYVLEQSSTERTLFQDVDLANLWLVFQVCQDVSYGECPYRRLALGLFFGDTDIR
jgi:hypothetical protein